MIAEETLKTWYVICVTKGTSKTEFFEGVRDGKNSWAGTLDKAMLMTEDLAESKAKGLNAVKPGGAYEFDHRTK